MNNFFRNLRTLVHSETNEHDFAVKAVSLREAIQYGLELGDISKRYAAPD